MSFFAPPKRRVQPRPFHGERPAIRRLSKWNVVHALGRLEEACDDMFLPGAVECNADLIAFNRHNGAKAEALVLNAFAGPEAVVLLP